MILNPTLEKSRNDEVTAGDIVTIHTIENKLKLIEKELAEASINIKAITISLNKINSKK